VNAERNLEVFARAANDEIWHVYQTPGAGDGWSDWASRGGPVISPPGGARNFDGRLQIFAQFRDNGGMRHAYQRAQGGLWSGWEHDYGVAMRGVPAVAVNQDSRLEVMITAADGSVYHAWQDNPGSDFGALEAMAGSHGAGQVGIGYSSGAIELWARAGDGSIAHAGEDGDWPNWSPWDGTQLLIGSTAGSYHDTNGQPVLCATRSDGHVVLRALDGGNWGGWNDLGGDAAGTPSLVANTDGRLETFVRGSNGMLQHRWQPW
jgi:hypothetical protein